MAIPWTTRGLGSGIQTRKRQHLIFVHGEDDVKEFYAFKITVDAWDGEWSNSRTFKISSSYFVRCESTVPTCIHSQCEEHYVNSEKHPCDRDEETDFWMPNGYSTVHIINDNHPEQKLCDILSYLRLGQLLTSRGRIFGNFPMHYEDSASGRTP